MTTPPSGPPSDDNPYQPYGQAGGQPDNPAGDPSYGTPYAPPTQPYGQPAYGQASSPYGAAPYGGYGYPMPPKTNGLAIGSLVTSIVSITLCMGLTGVVGAILGHVARGQIKRNNEQGAGLALAGIIVGWLGFGLFLVGVAFWVALVVWAGNSVDDCYTHSDGVYRCS